MNTYVACIYHIDNLPSNESDFVDSLVSLFAIKLSFDGL